MARKKKKTLNMGSRQKKAYSALNKRLAMYTDLVRGIIEDFAGEASRSAQSTGYTKGEKPFAFSDYPETRHAVTRMKQNFANNMSSIIYNGVSQEWRESNLYQDMLAEDFIRETDVVIDGRKRSHYYETDNGALKAFRRRQDKGLKLSENIWNQAKDMQTELEATLSCAIEKGMDAVTLSKRVSKYLEDYDKIKKDYKELYGKAVDIHDCEYRSMRLARSEINMAYRSAENARWQGMDFVIGMEIKTSNNHSEIHTDVCDELAGKYPKDFDWVGWHPNCRCFKIPILKKPGEAFDEDGESKPSPDEVKDMPDNFKDWAVRNKGRILAARDQGTEPYFIRDNRRKVNEVIGVKEGWHEGKGKTKKAREQKQENGLKDYQVKISKEQKQNIREIAKEFGLSVEDAQHLQPMGIFKALEGANPLKGDTNCQSCVVAFEARLRGLLVRAKSKTGFFADQLSAVGGQVLAYSSRAEVKYKPSIKVKKVDKVMDYLKQEIPDGRYQIGWDKWNKKTRDRLGDKDAGHILCLIKKDKALYFIDPQNKRLYTPEKFDDNVLFKIAKDTDIEIMRTDRLVFANRINEIVEWDN